MDSRVATTAIENGKLIEEEVECRPEKIPCSVLDETIDVYLIRQYFTNDAWMLVEQVIEKKREMKVWLCNICQKDLYIEESIVCESCLLWYHFPCVGIKKQPKKKKWFCRFCYDGCVH